MVSGLLRPGFLQQVGAPGLSLEPKVSGLESRVRRMLENKFMGPFLETCFCLEVYNPHIAPI